MCGSATSVYCYVGHELGIWNLRKDDGNLFHAKAVRMISDKVACHFQLKWGIFAGTQSWCSSSLMWCGHELKPQVCGNLGLCLAGELFHFYGRDLHGRMCAQS